MFYLKHFNLLLHNHTGTFATQNSFSIYNSDVSENRNNI